MKMQIGVVTVWMEVLHPHGGVCLRGCVTPCGAFCRLSTLSACWQWTVHSAAARERVSEGVVPSLIGGISELSGGEWWMGWSASVCEVWVVHRPLSAAISGPHTHTRRSATPCSNTRRGRWERRSVCWGCVWSHSMHIIKDWCFQRCGWCVCVVCISLSLSLSLSLCFLCVSVSPSGALWMCRSLVLFSDECLSSFFSLSRVEIRKCNVSVYLCLSYAGV